MSDTSLNVAAAVIAGLAGGLAGLIVAMVSLTWRPRTFPLHPLYLVGSTLTIETTAAVLSGLAIILVISAGYGIVVAALFSGFEAASALPLWGAIAGAALSIVTGTSIAYLRTVSPAARKGLIGDPGPFLIRYGGWQVAALIATHVLFGLVTGAVYAVAK